MSNMMSTVFIGYIVEAIYKDGVPTMELRVRVPSVHGANARQGINDRMLPIAKPMVIPGAEYSKETFADMIRHLNKVYIIFESGDYSKPVYFGLKGNSELYDLPTSSVFIRRYAGVYEFPTEGNSAYLYMAADTGMLYTWDVTHSIYKALITSTSGTGDTLIGTVNLFTNVGPISGTRVIDGIETSPGDKVLVVGAAGIDNAIYTVSSSGTWPKLINVEDSQIISIDEGALYAGTMLKINSSSVIIVKKSELTKWSTI